MTKHSPFNHLRARRKRAHALLAEIADLIQRMKYSFYLGESEPDEDTTAEDHERLKGGKHGSQRRQRVRGERTNRLELYAPWPTSEGRAGKGMLQLT